MGKYSAESFDRCHGVSVLSVCASYKTTSQNRCNVHDDEQYFLHGDQR